MGRQVLGALCRWWHAKTTPAAVEVGAVMGRADVRR
jgi:hypothetical protein